MTTTTDSAYSCRKRWRAHKDGRFSDLRRMIRAEERGDESGPEDLGPLNEYGLAFDYVDRDNGPGYWRYQLSWGGPADEIRFYSDGPGCEPYRIEYWFLDWFDGYGRKLVGRDLETAEWLWEWFDEAQSTVHAYHQAKEEE